MVKRGLIGLFLVLIILFSSLALAIMPEDEDDLEDEDDGELPEDAPLPVDFEVEDCAEDEDCPEDAYCVLGDCMGTLGADCFSIDECEGDLICDPSTNFCAIQNFFPCEDAGERSGCLESSTCMELEGFDGIWCIPNCDQRARSGEFFSGCEGDACTFNGDCAEGLFCYEWTCQETPPDYCVENSDCGDFSCFENYCVNPSCMEDADCPEGLTCTENICVAGMIACLDSDGCPENYMCSSRQCVRACSSDYNCGVYTLSEQIDLQVCNTQFLCEPFCNDHISTNKILGFNQGVGEYISFDLFQENPYFYAIGDATFNLREMEMILDDDTYQIISVIGYKGSQIFFDRKFDIYMFANQMYILDDEGNYYTPDMVETDVSGLYQTEPLTIEGDMDVNTLFSVERRELLIDVEGLTRTIDMEPLAIYYFIIPGERFYWLIVNDCEGDFDCFEDAHCEEGQFCLTDTHTCHDLIVIDGPVDDEEEEDDIVIPDAPAATGGDSTTSTSGSGFFRSTTTGDTCQNNDQCAANEYCLEEECLDKTSIIECEEQSGLVCDTDEACLSGESETIGDLLCCLGENDECMETEYNELIASTTIISRSGCVDEDGDNTGVREVSICYAIAGECSSENEYLVPASDLEIPTNPYFEECHIPTEEELKVPLHWTWYVLGGIVIVGIGLGATFFKPKKK